MSAIESVIEAELNRIVSTFVKRLIELEERYETPLPEIEVRREELSKSVQKHLEAMGVK